MSNLSLTIHSENPDFLDLPWETPLVEWDDPRLMDLPKGISRHEVRFVRLDQIYAIKELPTRPARQDYTVLRALEEGRAPAVSPVGLVEGRSDDPTEEVSAALITRYAEFSFSFRELIEGTGFGRRRSQLLAAFAGLLVELHLVGCYWGDCSLSNVLYRYDASGIKALMVDAETSVIYPKISDGQREEDLEIMEINVAGGMADIAASQGVDLDGADLTLGAEIRGRYEWLWDEVTREVAIPPDERWRVVERIRRLNELGFTVQELDLEEVEGGNLIRLHTMVGSRSYHADRLDELTAIEATEWQARHILADLYRYRSHHESEPAELAAMRWRVEVFEPALARLRAARPDYDPVQQYTDYLHFRYELSKAKGTDVDDAVAFSTWEEAGYPGFPLEETVTPP